MSGHVARRARMDVATAAMTSSAELASGNTPRSISWTRPKNNNGSMTERSVRSVSVSRVKVRDEAKEKEQEENARAAFEEWLRRKCKEPRTPKASPSREQICQHLKDDLKHKVYNTWLHNKKFERKRDQQNGIDGNGTL